ncbi:MAG: prepilin-type N-terminal cleavage/methylation domain-containing protein [Amphritea sp.]|nr:prepilin-type N-terminal cleavage/methylation domain-containing protein [Amphritea sp.]
MKPVRRDQQGFTLFELLVVVSVLAAMASIAAVAIDGYEQAAEEELVHVEMKNIAQAIHRYRADTGAFPAAGTDSTSDLSALFEQPAGVKAWDVNSGFGWHGPYLTPESQERLHIAGSGSSECNLNLDVGITVSLSNSVLALSDTFVRTRNYSDTDDCFVIRDDGNWVARDASGQPYHYETEYKAAWHLQCTTSSAGCIALISAGKDGVFADPSNTESDDIVKVLRVN